MLVPEHHLPRPRGLCDRIRSRIFHAEDQLLPLACWLKQGGRGVGCLGPFGIGRIQASARLVRALPAWREPLQLCPILTKLQIAMKKPPAGTEERIAKMTFASVYLTTLPRSRKKAERKKSCTKSSRG